MDVRERMAERRRIARVKGRYAFFWIRAIVDGRLYTDGPFVSEEEAWNMGYNSIDVNFSVVELNTRSKREATGRLKHDLLEETGDIRRSVRYAKHRRQEGL